MRPASSGCEPRRTGPIHHDDRSAQAYGDGYWGVLFEGAKKEVPIFSFDFESDSLSLQMRVFSWVITVHSRDCYLLLPVWCRRFSMWANKACACSVTCMRGAPRTNSTSSPRPRTHSGKLPLGKRRPWKQHHQREPLPGQARRCDAA